MLYPTISHWAVVEHILFYLREAFRREILYKKLGHTRIDCFSDADWAGSKEDKRSTLGYCLFWTDLMEQEEAKCCLVV